MYEGQTSQKQDYSVNNLNGDGQKGENNEQIPVFAQMDTTVYFQGKKSLKFSQRTSQNVDTGSLRTIDHAHASRNRQVHRSD